VSAFAAVKWMVSYLQRRDLNIFGWYRFGAGAVTLALVAASVI
jgi:undecaprenyl pyrophosphate phosphatase UppP